MDRDRLLEDLRWLAEGNPQYAGTDEEGRQNAVVAHLMADDFLLSYIDDQEIAELFIRDKNPPKLERHGRAFRTKDEPGMNRRQLGSERIVEIIEEEWASTRPPGGVGTTDSEAVYERLAAEGVDVPRRLVARVLETLWNEGFVEGMPYRDRSGKATREARPITEPKWHADLTRKLEGG